MTRLGYLSLLAATLFAVHVAHCAPDPVKQPLAEQPYLTLFIASVDQIHAVFDHVFESVERPDLAKSLADRLKDYRNLAGIERTKTLGMMSTWSGLGSTDIVFVPTDDIQELLNTATFGVVGFHEANTDHYEIERPGSPYHVLVRKGYAFFADSPDTIRGLRVTPEKLTRGLRDRFDIVLHLDLLQFPLPVKTKLVEELRSQIEPWLQPQDDEDPESANFRKTLGKLVLGLIERSILDTKSVTFGGRLDRKTGHLNLEVNLEAVSKSPMATVLNRMSSHRSEFAPLIQPDVPAGIALNLPISGLAEQILGPSSDPATNRTQMEAAFQLAGTGLGDLSIIAALNGPDAAKLNDTLPNLVLKLEQSGHFKLVRENFDIHQGIVLHSLTPREIPSAIAYWIGSDVEIIIGQGEHTIWMGMGHPTPLLDRLLDAIDLVDQPQTSRPTGQLVRARFQAQKLPELVASDLLTPSLEAARKAFSKGDDGFSLTVEPVSDGLKLQIDFEAGFVRMIGQGWISQIENVAHP